MEDEEILEIWKKELGLDYFKKKERKVEDIFRKVKVKINFDFEIEKIEELKRELEDEKLTEYRERFGERYGMMLYRLEQLRDAVEELDQLRKNSLYVWITIGRRTGDVIGIVQKPEDMRGVIVLFKHEPPRSLLYKYVYVTKYDIRLSMQKKKYVKAFEYYPEKFLDNVISENSSRIYNRFDKWRSNFYKELLKKAREMMDPTPVPEGVQIRIGDTYSEFAVIFQSTAIYFGLWGEPVPDFFERDEIDDIYRRTNPATYEQAVEYIVNHFSSYYDDDPEKIKKYAELAKKYIDALNEALAYAKLCVLSPEKVEELKNEL
ncbi:MAG: hypothetical protein ACTSXX_13355 [Candidatus Baldrarchaeia archaeon]